jgi:hypothetical protein
MAGVTGNIQSPRYTHGGGEAQGSKHVEGARAKERFASGEEVSEAEDWTAYKLANKLSFAASKKQHADKFADFRKKRQEGGGTAGPTTKDAGRALMK